MEYVIYLHTNALGYFHEASLNSRVANDHLIEIKWQIGETIHVFAEFQGSITILQFVNQQKSLLE